MNIRVFAGKQITEDNMTSVTSNFELYLKSKFDTTSTEAFLFFHSANFELNNFFGALIGVRLFFAGGGGAVNHLPKNSRKLPKFLRSSQKETRIICCTNIGLHMK